MLVKPQILTGLLLACFLQVSATAFCQTVVDDNRIAAGHYSRQLWNESVDSFKALIEKYPESLEASVGYFYLGESLMQLEDFRNAYQAFQQYLVRHPQSELSDRATFRLAEAAYHLGNDSTAIRLMETFIQQNPEHPLLEFALPYLGEMRLRRVEPQLAAKVFEMTLQRHPDGRLAGRSIIGLARSYQLAGEVQKALNTYLIAANDENHPLAAEADIQVAGIFLGKADYELARQHLMRALNRSSNPEQATEANYWLARVQLLEGDNAGALEILRLIIGKPAPVRIASKIYLDAALIAHQTGQSNQALEWLDELTRKFPNSEIEDAALHLQIEIAYVHPDESMRQRTGEFIDRFDKHFSDSPYQPGVLEKAGRYYYARQEYGRALAAFERLIKEDRFIDASRATSDRDNWLYLSALSQIGRRDYAAAETILGRINIATSSEEIRLLSQLALATARYGQKKYQAAIPGYQTFLDGNEKLPAVDNGQLLRARQELTLCFAETGLWKEANRSFKVLQKKYADLPVVNQTAEYMASLALKDGQSQAAVDILERVIVIDSDSKNLPFYLSSLGWLKYEAGERGQACELFHRLIEEYPDHELSGPAAMCLAKAFDEEKKHDRAAQQYGWVVRHFGTTEYGKIATLRRAHSLINTGDKQTYSEAKRLLQKYLAFDANPASKDEALFQLGWVSAELGSLEESQLAFLRLLEECPTSKYRPDSVLRLAQTWISENQLDRASKQLEAISDTTLLVPALRNRKQFLLGEIASRQGRWSEVSTMMTEIMKDTDQSATKVKAIYWLGEAAFRQGKFAEAEKHFRFIQANHHELSPELQPWIWLRLAQSLGQLETWQAAKQIAEDGIKRFPSFKSSFEFEFVIARGLEDKAMFSESRSIYEKVIASATGGSTETAAISQWRIGEMYFHQENYAEAIKAYYLVDSNYSYQQWRSAALLQAGKCQEHLSNWEHAKKLYKRLVEQFPDSPHRQAADERIVRLNQQMAKAGHLKKVKSSSEKQP
jgi:TolA-binding protein